MMTDLFAALALVLVLEGLVWAIFPRYGIRMLKAAVETPEAALRYGGALAAVVGLLIYSLLPLT
jgi:hypothetical protein